MTFISQSITTWKKEDWRFGDKVHIFFRHKRQQRTKVHTVKPLIRVDFLFFLFRFCIDSHYRSTLIRGRLLLIVYMLAYPLDTCQSLKIQRFKMKLWQKVDSFHNEQQEIHKIVFVLCTFYNVHLHLQSKWIPWAII